MRGVLGGGGVSKMGYEHQHLARFSVLSTEQTVPFLSSSPGP